MTCRNEKHDPSTEGRGGVARGRSSLTGGHQSTVFCRRTELTELKLAPRRASSSQARRGSPSRNHRAPRPSRSRRARGSTCPIRTSLRSETLVTVLSLATRRADFRPRGASPPPWSGSYPQRRPESRATPRMETCQGHPVDPPTSTPPLPLQDVFYQGLCLCRDGRSPCVFRDQLDR